jgi:hypothetical protein
VRDFMVNQQFRKDYWVKGARRLSLFEQARQIKDTRVVLTTPKEDVPLKINATLGEATLSEAVYGPILQELSDHSPKALGDLITPEINLGRVMEVALVLMGAGHLAIAQDAQAVKRTSPKATALNRHLTDKAQGSAEISFLASPLTGGGVAVNRFEQLFLREIGKKDPQQWASAAWALLKAQGQRIIKEGKTLESDEDNLAEITAQARAFEAKRLPLLRKLGVV